MWALLLYALVPLFSSAQNSFPFRDVIIVLAALLITVFCTKTLLFSASLLLYPLLYLSALLSTLLSSYIGIQSTMITYLAFAGIVVLFSGLEYSHREIRIFKEFYIWLGVICACLIVLSWVFNKPYGWQRYSLDVIGLHKNPNYINNIILLSIAFCIENLIRSNRRKLLDAVLIVAMCFGCFLTGTRAALLCIGLLLLFAVGYLLFIRQKFAYLVLLLASSAAGYVLIVNTLPSSILNRLIGETFFKDDGRIFMWTSALKEWSRQPVFGMGIDGVSIYTMSHKLPILNIHNIHLQFLCDQGLVGLVLFLAVIWFIVHRTRRQDRFLLFLMMIALFVPTLFQNGTVAYTFWWPLTVLEIFSRKSYRTGLQTL